MEKMIKAMLTLVLALVFVNCATAQAGWNVPPPQGWEQEPEKYSFLPFVCEPIAMKKANGDNVFFVPADPTTGRVAGVLVFWGQRTLCDGTKEFWSTDVVHSTKLWKDLEFWANEACPLPTLPPPPSPPVVSGCCDSVSNTNINNSNSTSDALAQALNDITFSPENNINVNCGGCKKSKTKRERKPRVIGLFVGGTGGPRGITGDIGLRTTREPVGNSGFSVGYGQGPDQGADTVTHIFRVAVDGVLPVLSFGKNKGSAIVAGMGARFTTGFTWSQGFVETRYYYEGSSTSTFPDGGVITTEETDLNLIPHLAEGYRSSDPSLQIDARLGIKLQKFALIGVAGLRTENVAAEVPVLQPYFGAQFGIGGFSLELNLSSSTAIILAEEIQTVENALQRFISVKAGYTF